MRCSQGEGSYSRRVALGAAPLWVSWDPMTGWLRKITSSISLITLCWKRMRLAVNESHYKCNEAPGKHFNGRFLSKLAVAGIGSMKWRGGSSLHGVSSMSFSWSSLCFGTIKTERQICIFMFLSCRWCSKVEKALSRRSQRIKMKKRQPAYNII